MYVRTYTAKLLPDMMQVLLCTNYVHQPVTDIMAGDKLVQIVSTECTRMSLHSGTFR